MSLIAPLYPGSDLPRPQTHIFPGVSRLPRTAGFTLHRKGGEGVWPHNCTRLCPGLRPILPSHPAALAVLGHLWLPGNMGIRDNIGETQGGWHEAQGQMWDILWTLKVVKGG